MAWEILRFADFELDRGAYELRCNGSVVRLESIPLALLFLLAGAQGRLVTRQEILEQVWGKNVFVDIESSINTAVRKLRKALRDDADSPTLIVTVPTKGYRFVASVRQAARTPPDAHQRSVLVVLPFENLSGDPQQEYFSDGLMEEAITDLGQLASDGLGVIARTTAISYKNTSKTIAEIGAELGAGFALEGSVRREGTRVRISAQLIRTSDQTHLWADSYDRELKDILTMQAELGRAIAHQVRLKLTPAWRPVHQVDPDAYDAYLRGRHTLWRLTRADIERAIEYYRRATEIDPGFAAPWAGLADAYNVLPITSDVRPHDAFPKSERAAREALLLDPALAEAHSALAGINFWYHRDWVASEQHIRRAIEFNPSYSMAHLWYGHMLSNLARHKEAMAAIERARELDPLSLITNTLYAQFRYQARRYGEAVILLAKALDLDPHFWVARLCLGKVYHQQRRYDDALAEFEKAGHSSGGNLQPIVFAGHTAAALGRRDQARQVLARLHAIRGHQYVPPYFLALMHFALGEIEPTFQWFDEAVEERDVHLVFLQVEPSWDGLLSDARFRRLLHRVGLRTGPGSAP